MRFSYLAAAAVAFTLAACATAQQGSTDAGSAHAETRAVSSPSPSPMPTPTPTLLPSPPPAPARTPASLVPAAAPTVAPTEAPTASPAPTQTPSAVPQEPPDAAPEIVSLKLDKTVVHAGDTVSGIIRTSSNVASVEARIADYSIDVPKIAPGEFAMRYAVPNIPIFLRKTYQMTVIARNTAGDAATTSVPITIR